ncbi:dynein heavy chain, N-terminal region 2-domain-containing protein, partial [Dunaliella salina]
MESDLLEVLRDMRTGMMTSTSAPRAQMGAALSNKERLLQELSKQHAQCAAWAKLLTHGGVEQTMAEVRKLMGAATHVLAARTRLWHVLGEWGELMDTMYATPCFGEGVCVRSLVERLEMDLEELAEEVEGITSLHTADDISSVDTVTPEEANLGAHYSVVVCAWQDMLPFAQQLIHSTFKPRHFCILVAWLRTYRSPRSPSFVALDERYPVPPAHVSPPGMSMQANLPAEPLAVPVCKSGAAAAEAAAAAEREAASMALAQLLSRCTESKETRALTNRIIEVAAAEQQLDSMMSSLQNELASVCIEFSQQRIFGVFIITNAKEVLAQISSLESLLAGVRDSPHYGGVMPQFELTEQFLREAAQAVACALRCQDWVLLLSQLFSCAEVAAACPHAAAVWEPLGVEWRKITLAAHDAGYLPPCMQVLQGIDVLEKALEQVYVLVSRQMLPAMRADYPRLHFVADRLLMEGLAAANDVSCLPAALLEACYQGLRSISCLPDDGGAMQGPSKGAASPAKATNAAPPLIWAPQEVVGVEASSGEPMALTVGLSYSAAQQPLAHFLANLELALRLSFKAHTKNCMEACGVMQ